MVVHGGVASVEMAAEMIQQIVINEVTSCDKYMCTNAGDESDNSAAMTYRIASDRTAASESDSSDSSSTSGSRSASDIATSDTATSDTATSDTATSDTETSDTDATPKVTEPSAISSADENYHRLLRFPTLPMRFEAMNAAAKATELGSLRFSKRRIVIDGSNVAMR